MPTSKVSTFKHFKTRFKLPSSATSFFLQHKKFFNIVTSLILLSFIFLLLWQIYQVKFPQSPPSSSQSSLSPSPSPCISNILPSGKQIYQNSRGKDVVGPKLFDITIDPFDPQQGQKINVTAVIKNDSPVTKAIVILTTDNKTVEENMKLVSGETTDGTWTTEIKLEDTYLCIYKLGFNLQSETGNYEGTMVYRQ